MASLSAAIGTELPSFSNFPVSLRPTRRCRVSAGYPVNTMPERTFALILALRRSLIAFTEDARRGQWQQAGQFCFFGHPINELGGSRLGIVAGAGFDVLAKEPPTAATTLRRLISPLRCSNPTDSLAAQGWNRIESTQL